MIKSINPVAYEKADEKERLIESYSLCLRHNICPCCGKQVNALTVACQDCIPNQTNRPQPNAKVIVTVYGGMVTDIKAPKFVDVTVRDYDTDGAPLDELERDEDGMHYRKLSF